MLTFSAALEAVFLRPPFAARTGPPRWFPATRLGAALHGLGDVLGLVSAAA